MQWSGLRVLDARESGSAGQRGHHVPEQVGLSGVEVGSLVDGRRHAGFEATGEIRRSDFGAGLLGDVVKVQLDMRFVEPQGQGG